MGVGWDRVAVLRGEQRALLSSPFSASLLRGALAGSSLRRQPPPSWDWPISRTASEELLVPAQET